MLIPKTAKPLLIWRGPVASEKTTRALYAAKRYVRTGHDLVLVRPKRSRRGHETDDGFLCTKAGERWPCIDIVKAAHILSASAGADVVWLDEPFMFEEESGSELFDTVCEIQSFATVLMSTITATSERKPINRSVSDLVAISDKVFDCYGDCDCCGQFNEATRSLHLAGVKSEAIKVGGEESYEPRCPACWNKAIEELVGVLQT
jgi:thymidine kinase